MLLKLLTVLTCHNQQQRVHQQDFPKTTNSPYTTTGTTTTTGDQGGLAIALGVPEIGYALLDPLRLPALGARVLTNLSGNTNLPADVPGLSAAWLSENAVASDTTTLFQTLALLPQRVVASLPVSQQLLIQTPENETYLRQTVLGALAVEIQRVAIVGAGHGSNQPLGILSTTGVGAVAGGTNGAAPTYNNVCDLEYSVSKADLGNLGWMLSPAVRRKLRETPIFTSGSVPIWPQSDAYSLLGHPAGVTTGSPDNLTKGTSAGNCSSIVIGEWSEFFLGLWGAGVEVDAFRSVAQAKIGEVTLVASVYVDSGIRIPSAFSVMSDALC